MPLNHHNVNNDLSSYDSQSPLGAAYIKVCSACIDSIITTADLTRMSKGFWVTYGNRAAMLELHAN